jgi:putative hydrolase of HD superfamily
MSLIELLKAVQNLKRIPRSGWIAYGVVPSQAESVASHTFATSFLTMLLADSLKTERHKINIEKALKMALLHDLTETLTFDISKYFLAQLGEEGEKLKEKLEREAERLILSKLSVSELSAEYQQLLEDLRKEESVEAKIVKGADNLDLLLQILNYENMGYSKEAFENLWREVENRVSSSGINLLISLLEELKKLRGKPSSAL